MKSLKIFRKMLLRGAQRRSNLKFSEQKQDCFALRARNDARKTHFSRGLEINYRGGQRDDLNRPLLKLNRTQRILLESLLLLFLILAIGVDYRPAKKIYFYSHRCMAGAFEAVRDIEPAQRYNMGQALDSNNSCYYLLLAKLFHYLIPARMLCLRALSIAASFGALIFLFLIARRLFNPRIALLYIFLLAVSPAYLESFRSFGYIPLSNLIFVAALYLLIRSINDRRAFLPVILLAFFSFMSLSLYAPYREIILIVVLSYLLYLKSQKFKLLVYLLLSAGFILGSDAVFQDIHIDWARVGLLKHPEGCFQTKSRNWDTKEQRITRNLRICFSYLANLDRRPFADEEKRSRLFNPAYTPFLVIGLGVSLWRRKRGHILLLLWFMVTFFSPLTTMEVPPRRILGSLPAIYLLLALGLYTVYGTLLKVPGIARHGKAWAGTVLCSLALIGGFDIHEYIFSVSRPYYNYSAGTLKTIGDFVVKQLKGGAWIYCNSPTRDLIWGNRYFTDRIYPPGKAGKAFPNPYPFVTLKPVILESIKRKRRVIYLYTSPRVTARYGPADYRQLRDDIDYLKAHNLEELNFSMIPGTTVYYVATLPGGIKAGEGEKVE